MRYGTVALACIAMLCASETAADEAMRRLGDLRRSDYVVTSLDSVTNDVAGLKAAVGTVSNDVVSLKGDYSTLSNDVSDLREAVSALGDMTNGISALTGYSDLTNDVVSLKGDYSTLSNSIDGLQADVNGLSSALSTTTNSIDQLGRYASNSWDTADAYLDYLEDYATNNYMAARLANYRAYRLELWRQSDTNDLAEIGRYASNSWDTADAYLDYLEDYATNNYMAARLANYRAYRLELWRQSDTNDLAEIGRYASNSWDTADAYLDYLEDYATNNYMAARLANYRAYRLELWRQSDTNDLEKLKTLLARSDASTNVTFKIDGDELVISTNSVPVWRSSSSAGAVSLTQAVEVVTNASASAVKAMTASVQTNEIAGAMTLSVGDRSVTFYDTTKVDEKVEAAGKDAGMPALAHVFDTADWPAMAKPHALVTYAPTNAVADALDLTGALSRNFEVYIPNTGMMRQALPLAVRFEPTNGTAAVKVGPWWGRAITRLPALFKFREPIAGTVIVDAETYDDGTDWTPVVTNVVWVTTNGVMTLEKVQGYNLHNVASVGVAYIRSTGAVETGLTTNFVPLYASLDMRGAFAGDDFQLNESELREGTTPEVTVTPVTGTYRNLNQLLDEANRGWR